MCIFDLSSISYMNETMDIQQNIHHSSTHVLPFDARALLDIMKYSAWLIDNEATACGQTYIFSAIYLVLYIIISLNCLHHITFIVYFTVNHWMKIRDVGSDYMRLQKYV